MSITTTTNADDPPPRVRLWVDVDQYVAELEVADAATRRLFLDDLVEATEVERCEACEHAHENHDRAFDGGPCSLCDCRGYQDA